MRKYFLPTAIAATIIISYLMFVNIKFLWIGLPLLLLILLGFYDYFQTKHSITRNFPIIGHSRYLLEELGPEIRQYFVESDTNGSPFTRLQRKIIYSRAKLQNQNHPFGTELNVYQPDYEWMPHSIYPAVVQHTAPRILIGGKDCLQPYSAARLNISAMSYGALSKAAVLAFSKGASHGGFYHNTGEGGVSPYHLQGGADLVYQLGTGYFGSRNDDGTFSVEKFRKTSSHPNIKMVEIKISQGAKPGHGGVLPASKNTPEIASIRGVTPGVEVLSPPGHSAFDTASGLIDFIKTLRENCGGKPVGFKLCIGRRDEFIDICNAMISKNILPDFITIDGGEGGTGAAPLEFSNSVGMPLEDALVFVIDTLRGYNLKKDIKVIASGKIVSAFDIIKYMSIGADLCNSARGMMMSLGCIQALECDRNTCPTGITTHKPELMAGLVVEEKYIRVANFQNETLKCFMELVAAAGITDLSNLHRGLIHQRLDTYHYRTFEEIYPSVAEGSYLQESYLQESYFQS